jgi:ABC-2 type transport system ATP-binding protein
VSNNSIVLEHVSRWYGQVIGVNDITCTIGPGITALLGMNGAGKSTLLKLITGQLMPSTGRVLVGGMQPFGNPSVYAHLGYCPESDNFVEHMNGFKFVQYMGELSGMDAATAKARSREVVEQVGMSDRAHKPIGGYSKGMRQRIKLAQAMVHNPKIILLDEPLNGLDPVGRHEFLTVLGQLATQGKAILVSSHILFEVEQMTRSILLLHRGRVLANGDLSLIRELIDKYPHKVRVESPKPRELAGYLMQVPGVLSTAIGPREDSLLVEAKNTQALYDKLGEVCLENDIPILGFTSPDDNLESIFNYLVN